VALRAQAGHFQWNDFAQLEVRGHIAQSLRTDKHPFIAANVPCGAHRRPATLIKSATSEKARDMTTSNRFRGSQCSTRSPTTSTFVEPELDDSLSQERRFLVIAIEQCDMRLRRHERQRDTRKSGATANVEHAASSEVRQRRQRIENMPAHHFSRCHVWR
jgi:hypothetical protein